MQRLPQDTDDMSRWLVDICNQLGVDDVDSAARHWGSPPASEARSPSRALDVSQAPQLPMSASICVPYASSPVSSSSSSPGSASSSGESVGAAKGTRRAPTATRSAPSDGAAKDLTEARREKNRLRVRRHYYRKLALMNDLRAQVSELEERVAGLQPLQSASDAGGSMYLQQLDATRRALERENQQMRALLYQQTKQFMFARQQHLQRLLDEAQLLGASMPVPFIIKKRLAPAECDAIWQRTKRELSSLVICNKLPSARFAALSGGDDDDGDSICGWKTTRAIEDGAFKFVFQKLLRGCSPTQALDAAWGVFSDPKRFARLYSPTVDMWCALVQVVDADNVVLFQEHKSMDRNDTHLVMKTILLASRVRHGDDFSITLRGIEHEQLGLEDLSVSPRDGHEVWNDINCCLQWTPRGECCECKVSGAIPTVGSNAYFWMVEVLLIVMRLEATTAGPSLLDAVG